jgi:polyhydroxyalkanoate synthesis regulator phasin
VGTSTGAAGSSPTEENTVRKKIVLATTAGVLAVGGGLAFTVPAIADDETTPESAATSVEDRIRDALSGLVDDGSLTAEQADEVATTLSDADLRDHGSGPWPGLSVAAETLGLSEDDLRTALEAEGATLASVAGDQGVAVEDLVAALVQAGRERLDEAVAEGRLTQEQADERAAEMQTWVTDMVNGTGFGDRGPHGGWGRGWGGPHGEDD